MKICRTRAELDAVLTRWRANGDRIGLIPTMGALHDGHLSLVDVARGACDKTIATIFVNPLQFAPHEDFDEYPRNLDGDVGMLKARECDAVFAPASSELFAADFSVSISVAGVGENHCAVARPHFFDGVATIVAKLLLLVRPDVAVFGEKDFQQLAVIRRMVRDLEVGVRILGAPIIRESDGLAMSSRNEYLTAQQRAVAPALYNAITKAAARIAMAEARWGDVAQAAIAEMLNAGFTSVDYVNLVDAKTLVPIDSSQRDARILAAAHIGGIRLIDNVGLGA